MRTGRYSDGSEEAKRSARRAALLRMIEDCARDERPLPFDSELGAGFGCTEWAVRADLLALQTIGSIRLVTQGRGGNAQRIVTLRTGPFEGRSTAARTVFDRPCGGSGHFDLMRARAGEAPLPPVVIALTAQSGLKLGEASVPGDVWLRVVALAMARGVKAARLVPALIEAGLDAHQCDHGRSEWR